MRWWWGAAVAVALLLALVRPAGADYYASCANQPAFFCLAGRSGGQTVYGSNTTGENLTLTANSADATGKIFLNGLLVANAAGTIVNNANLLEIAPTSLVQGVTTFDGVSVGMSGGARVPMSVTVNSALQVGYQFAWAVRPTANQTGNLTVGVDFGPSIEPADGANIGASIIGMDDYSQFVPAGSTGTGTINSWVTINVNRNNSAGAVTYSAGLKMMATAGAASEFGLDVQGVNQTSANDSAGVRLAFGDTVHKYGLLGTGTNKSFLRGGIRLGGATPTQPQEQLEVLGNTLLLANGATPSELRFQEPSGADYTAFKAGVQTGSITYILPVDTPVANDVLTATAPSGGVSTLSWETSGGGANCTTGPTLACLAGRTGATNDPTISSDADGTIYGSGGSGNALILNATSSNASQTPTRVIRIQDNVTTLAATNSLRGLSWIPPGGITASGAYNSIRVFNATASISYTADQNTTGELNAYLASNTLTANEGSGTTELGTFKPFVWGTHFVGGSSSPHVTLTSVFTDETTLDTATAVVAELNTITSSPGVLSSTAEVTLRRGLYYKDMLGGGKQPTSIALDVEDQSNNGTFTMAAALRSAITSGTGKRFLESTGDAISTILGNVTIGSNTAGAEKFNVTGNIAGTGNLTMGGSAHSFGTAGTSNTVNFGLGTTGTDGSILRIRSGNSGTTQPSIRLNRNDEDFTQWNYNGTDTFFDYATTGVLFFRAGIIGTKRLSLTSGGDLTLGIEAAEAAPLLRLKGTSSGYTVLKSGNASATTYTFTLPPDDGVAGQVQQTDGSGVMTWTTPEETKCLTIDTPASTDDVIWFKAQRGGLTMAEGNCIVAASTSAAVTLNDCNADGASCAALDTATCGTTNTAFSALANDTVAVDHWVRVDVGTVTGTVGHVTVCVTYSGAA